MDLKRQLQFIILIMTIRLAKGFAPGTFFWKPRLGLDLAIPITEKTLPVHKPTKQNIADGFVVLINGYQAGVSFLALAVSISETEKHPHLSPVSAYFYTNAYRWALRYFSLIPHWLGGTGGNYCSTHKTWRRRFYYMDDFVPKWMRKLLPYVKDEEWAKEEWEWKRFKKYAEPAFGKHYRYPSKTFRDFASERTVESAEGLDSDNSLVSKFHG